MGASIVLCMVFGRADIIEPRPMWTISGSTIVRCGSKFSHRDFARALGRAVPALYHSGRKSRFGIHPEISQRCAPFSANVIVRTVPQRRTGRWCREASAALVQRWAGSRKPLNLSGQARPSWTSLLRPGTCLACRFDDVHPELSARFILR